MLGFKDNKNAGVISAISVSSWPLGISLLSGLAGGVAAILCMLTGRFNDSVEER